MLNIKPMQYSCERRKSRAAAQRRSERRRSSLCERRRRRRIPSAMREQLNKYSCEEIARRILRGSRSAVLRRCEPTRFSSANDDEVGGSPARSAASGVSNQTERDARAAQ
jgi:hypothetical protein